MQAILYTKTPPKQSAGRSALFFARHHLASTSAGLLCLCAAVAGISLGRFALGHVTQPLSSQQLASQTLLQSDKQKPATILGGSPTRPSTNKSTTSSSSSGSTSTTSNATGSTAPMPTGTGASSGAAAPKAPAVGDGTTLAESFGAVGDGVSDDTAALQAALDSLDSSKVLVLQAGKTYRHTSVLNITKTGAHISGPGTLLATNEQLSGIFVKANNVTLDGGLTLRMSSTTKRWSTWQQMKLVVFGYSGAIIRNVTVDGSAAAGIMMQGASNYLLEDVTVKNTRADGIHNTGISHDGVIRRPIVQNTGDDGVAVVSYTKDGGDCYNIQVESPRYYTGTGGRGFTVVGGHDITFTDVYAENSVAAAIYIGGESNSSWHTYPAYRVKVLSGTLKNSNTKTTVDHGAILILNQDASMTTDSITIRDITITNTRSTASRQVSLLNYAGSINRVLLSNFTITGGGNLFGTLNVPAGNYSTIGWTWNGKPQLPHLSVTGSSFVLQ